MTLEFMIQTRPPFRSASPPLTTSISPALSPDVTSTSPSAVLMPRFKTRSAAVSFSTTKARKPRSLGRTAVWGGAGASRAPPAVDPARVPLRHLEPKQQGVTPHQRRHHRAHLDVLPGLDGARLEDAA